MSDDAKRILLVDLSAIFHMAYHVSGGEDADATCRKTVARIRGMAQSFEHIAVCGDARRNWRYEKLPTYKANREAKPPEFGAQLQRAIEVLRDDGFPVWVVDGFEADDVIATATRTAVKAGMHVVIMTHDKDLAQLLGDNPIEILDIKSNQIRGPAYVLERYGVQPEQLGDWLAIVGDASDNIQGAKGIGPKGATALLQRFGSLDGVIDAVTAADRLVEWDLRTSHGEDPAEVQRLLGPRPVLPDPPLKPAAHEALKSGADKLRLARELIGLRLDVPIPFDEALRERKPRARPTSETNTTFDDEELQPMNDETTTKPEATADTQPAPAPTAPDSKPDAAAPPEAPAERVEQPITEPAAIVQRHADRDFDAKNSAIVQASAGGRAVAYERTLEPQTLGDALKISRALHESRLFSATFNSAEAIFAAHLLARSHGIETMKVLMPGMVHNIKGKLSMSAVMIVGLVLRSGLCEYFEVVETTTTKAVYATKRKGGRREIQLEFTIDEARAAGYLGKPDSSWQKTPKTMLRHRCETELARAVYPDVVGGLYTPEEIEDAS